jgi:hypothetical protein
MLASPISDAVRHDIHMQEYLEELSQLVGREVSADELGGLEQARAIRDIARKFNEAPITPAHHKPGGSYEIAGEERQSERLFWFFQRLRYTNPSPVYVWTPRTICCGTFLLPSIEAINTGFDLDLNEEGVLVLLSCDLEDGLLLDFAVSADGKDCVSLQTRGANWASVAY